MPTSTRDSVVLPSAMKLPVLQKLQHRRVILASASPRRKEELAKVVRQARFMRLFKLTRLGART